MFRLFNTLSLVVVLMTMLLPSALADSRSGKAMHFMQSEMPNFEAIRDDLPSLKCNSVIQDKDGFIWVATSNGVARYDGKYTHAFANQIDETDKNTAIKSLSEDTISGYIWAAYSAQKTLIRIDQRTFEVKEMNYELSEDDKDTFFNLVNLNDSLLLASARSGFYTVNKETGYAQQVYQCEKRPNISPKHGFFMHRGKLLNVSGGEMYAVEYLAPGVVDIKKVMDRRVGIVFGACEFNDSLILVSVLKGDKHLDLVTYNMETKHLEELAIEQAFNYDFCVADDGIWLATNHGLKFFRFRDRRVIEFSTSNSKLQENSLSSIIKVREQPIFFIASSDGLIKMNYFSSKFNLTDMRRYSVARDADVWSMCKDHLGNYWIGCIDGLYYRDSGSLYYKRVDVNSDDPTKKMLIMGVEETKERDAIIFNTRFGVYKSDLEHKHIKIIYEDKAMRIYNTQVMEGHKVLVTTVRGIFILDTESGKQEFLYKSGKQNGTFTYSHTDDFKTLWFSDSEKVLKKLNMETLEVNVECNIDEEYGAICGIRQNNIGGVNELWFYTVRGALFYKIPGFPGVEKVKNNILRNYAVKAVEVDKHGDVWISTEIGLVRIATNETQLFSPQDFAVCQKFISRSSCIGPDGEILMGGSNSFVEFIPETFDTNTYFPMPTLASYRYLDSRSSSYDQLAKNEYIYKGDSIDVPAGIRSLRLFVRVLSYDRPAENAYQWRLDGTGEWTTTLSYSDVSLYNISEGDHVLELRSLDQIGDVKSNTRHIYIHKDVFFFETTAFYVLLVFLLIGAVFFIIELRKRQYNKMREYLMAELNLKNNMLIVANKEILDSQREISQKNEELMDINTNLEHIVETRTHDLEIQKIKAEESNELKSAFLASLSHEIRTPMNAIVGFAKLLQMQDCSEEERKEFAHLIIESSRGMLSLIGSLLDTSRIERGVIEISMNDFNAYKEIHDTWSILQVERTNRDVEFLLDADEDIKELTICSDRDRLRQIIVNLTYNALKFTTEGHVKIVARLIYGNDLNEYDYKKPIDVAKEKLLLIYVEDTGIGILQKELDIIFEPFRRVKNTNKVHYGGLGLGLNIVRNLVRLLGGDVWVSSVLGKGSTFYFYIPIEGTRKKK